MKLPVTPWATCWKKMSMYQWSKELLRAFGKRLIFKIASEEHPRGKRNRNNWFVVFPGNLLIGFPRLW